MAGNLQTEPISIKMARSVINRFTSKDFLWHYEHGLALQSLLAVAKKYNLTDFEPYAKSMYDTKINDDGSINTYKKDEFNLDQVNPGKNLFQLYKNTKDEKYRKAIEVLRNQLSNQPRTQSGGFWHKKIYPWQMWLDGLYMAEPFYSRYAIEFGSDSDFDDILNQFEMVYSHTRNKENGLLYHAWDESCKQLWADRETGCSPHFWGRAMGWFCMAVMDVIDIIDEALAAGTCAPTGACAPAGCCSREKLTSVRTRLAQIANTLVSPVISVQDDSSGLWYQVLDMKSRAKNYLETSCSAMFTCFLYRMARADFLQTGSTEKGNIENGSTNKVLSRESILDSAKKGWNGLLSYVSTDKDGNLHLGGICSVAGLGGNPYRDGSYAYYVKEAVVSDDFKGVGPFIFAALEAESVNESR